MSKKYKSGEKVLCLHGFPYGKCSVVEIIEKRKDREDHYYIRKRGGGTDTYNAGFLMPMPDYLDLNTHKYYVCFSESECRELNIEHNYCSTCKRKFPWMENDSFYPKGLSK